MNNNHGKIQELRILFKKCLDILRNDAEHLIGDETLNELSYFLILKQSEKHILNGSIDIYNLKYYSEGLCEYGEKFFIENLEYVKFSNLVKYVKIQVNECNIKNLFDNFIWNEVLSKHPKFKDVFEDGKKSFIRQPKTIKKIVIALGDIDFDKYDLDILGEAYESIFVDAVFGAGGNKKSELGQFFTPPKVKNLLVNLVDPKIKENGEIESVLDPASGTGGILNSVIKHFSSKIHDKEKLRKQLIDNIYGIEIKGKIFNLCLSNMLINTGEILPKVICSDSIRQFHNIKIDNIIANPPFSVTIKYEDLLSSLGSLEILDDYIPIKTGGKNSEMLFLQMMIHCLNINGRCSTVMLDGEKIYSSSSGYGKVREYLMRSCDLHEVILCPGGTFTSTNSRTCILFFTKKRERAEVLEITGTKRNLKFLDVKNHATENVKFYNFNPNTEEKEFIKEVSIEEIANRKYSLNHNEYQIIEEMKKVIGNIEWKELGEVCDFIPKSKRPASYGNKIGNYPFFKSSNKLDSYVDSPDYEIESLIIGDGGDPNINYGTLFSCSDHCFILQNKDNLNVNLKYIYYYIFSSLCKLDHLYTGAAMKNISKSNVSSIKIPFPSLEKQTEIVKFLDSLFMEKYNLQSFTEYYGNGDLFRILLDEKYSTFKNLVEWYSQSDQMRKQIDFYKNNKIKYLDLVEETLKNSEWKELGELCEKIKGDKRKSKDALEEGLYPFYYCSILGNLFMNTYDYTDEGIIINKTNGSGKSMVYYCNGKYNVGESTIHFKSSSNYLNTKYVYYYLFLNLNKLEEYYKGSNQKSITDDDLFKFKISVPTLEKQKEIVKRFDYYNDIIKQIEKEIENNKITAHTFLQDIITHIEEEQTERVKEEDEDILLIETEEVVPTVKPKLKLKVKKQEISRDEDDSISVSESSSSSSPSCKHIYKDGRKCETTPKKNPNYCSKHCK